MKKLKLRETNVSKVAEGGAGIQIHVHLTPELTVTIPLHGMCQIDVYFFLIFDAYMLIKEISKFNA